ncbi:MAG: tetratricopeptide repeat protein [Thermoanaerobaculia bacterium]
MNRDSALLLLVGLLAGFIAGYLMHEQMAAVQPARVPAGSATTASAAPAGDAGGASAAAPGGPQMAQIQALRARLDKSPNDTDAMLELANLNFDIQSWDRARELYERYLQLKPGDPDVLTDLGICYRSLGEADKALESFHRAQKIRPDHWQSLFNEVVVLAFDRQDGAAAEKVLAGLEKLQPQNPDVQRLASEVRARRGAGS